MFLTAEGHPRAIFQRAIERKNLLVAEAVAREMGHVTLQESLALTALIAEKADPKRSRYCARWLRRLLDGRPKATIEEALLAAQALSALGGPAHEHALAALESLAADAARPVPAQRRR